MSKRTRARKTRRDRRKAKQSDWKRPGKSNSAKVGHGGSGMSVGKGSKNILIPWFLRRITNLVKKTVHRSSYDDGFENKLEIKVK